MKTILYNPIFINPQAYYVFPRLTRWLRPDNGYKEPANYIGQIEVTIIAYGEIGYTEYFEHTNYIDFTNFSNSYVRISLFTRLGSCVLGEWKIGAMESDRPYIEPEVLASLKAVVIVGDKTNQDKDRDTVANLVDASNPFVISNASYSLNSGYGKYSADFEHFDWTTDIINIASTQATVGVGGRLCNHTAIEIDEMKVNIEGDVTDLRYWYIANSDDTTRSEMQLTSGINVLPKSYAKDDGQTYIVGFAYISGNSNITIEQIPEFQGAFITDGVNDLIMSTKTVREMLGGSDQITAISMIGYIDSDYDARINFAGKTFGNTYLNNRISAATGKDKTYILGYTKTSSSAIATIDIPLGDKADCSSAIGEDSSINETFSVAGYIKSDNTASYNAVAWYWTVIANKVLTTDQINQVIAYYDLDKYLEPTVLYNVKRQGLSNDTPTSEWYLKDYSKNGYDMTLNNFSKAGGSGIAAKQGERVLKIGV